MVFEKFKKAQIRDAKRGLAANKKKDTGSLGRSLKGVVKKFAFRGAGGKFTGGTTMPSLDFSFNEYGKYVDEGVKGSKSSTLAPNSRYKYSGNKKAVNVTAIRQWLGRKGLPLSLTYIISKKVYERGLKTTNFWSSPFRKNLSKYVYQYQKAIADDIATNVSNKLMKQMQSKIK